MILPYDEEEYWAERNHSPTTEGMADAEYARNKGRERPDCPWILSDRDAWYRNPFYVYPKGQPYPRHPEDDYYE